MADLDAAEVGGAYRDAVGSSGDAYVVGDESLFVVVPGQPDVEVVGVFVGDDDAHRAGNGSGQPVGADREPCRRVVMSNSTATPSSILGVLKHRHTEWVFHRFGCCSGDWVDGARPRRPVVFVDRGVGVARTFVPDLAGRRSRCLGIDSIGLYWS